MDLNIAWIIKWKKDNFQDPIINENIIKPNWERVDSAIIFFESLSLRANVPVIKIVNNEIGIRISFHNSITLWNRIIKYNPAVTKVEEWTNEETGVGAAIAAGNQTEIGNCALLVIDPKKNIIIIKELFSKILKIEKLFV